MAEKILVGQKAPDFTLPDCEGKPVSLSGFKGRNVVLFFYPLDWTPVWSSELPGLEQASPQLKDLNAQVLGISVDSHACHRAFADKLGVTFPLLSDLKREVSHLYGVFMEDKGICSRTTVIVDKEGLVRYFSTNDLAHRRDEKELLRILKLVNAG